MSTSSGDSRDLESPGSFLAQLSGRHTQDVKNILNAVFLDNVGYLKHFTELKYLE